MKVILTGATGKIGFSVLNTLLANPNISTIIALSRRDLPVNLTSTHQERLRNVILSREDFISYPSHVMAELNGAEACIWALGRTHGTRDSEVEFPLAAARKFREKLAPLLNDGIEGEKRSFTFVLVSGMGVTEEMQHERLFWMQARKLKSETMSNIIPLASETFRVIIAKPGGVLAPENSQPNWLVGIIGLFIKSEELSAALVKLTTRKSEGVEGFSKVLENADLRRIGRNNSTVEKS